jgi:tRNA threonylcarbamoyl adenosine modification protein YeaZ
MVPELDARARAGKTAGVQTVLAIVGCGPRLELALGSPALASPALVALSGPTPRSDMIVAAIDLMLRAAGLTPGAIEAVVATHGPGSFTGIRVALATAQGLARAAGAPAHAFSSLLAQAARTAVRPCLAVQPARRGEVYLQRYAASGAGGGADGEPELAPLAALAGAGIPVVAPAGLPLPPGTPTAAAAITAAEALLLLAGTLNLFDPDTLVPVYVDSAPAAPGARMGPSWQRSHRAS